MKKPKTPSERQAAYIAKGRQIAVLIRDPAALKSLERLESKHGGVTAAITFALHAAALKAKPPH